MKLENDVGDVGRRCKVQGGGLVLRVCGCSKDARDGGYIRRGGRVTLADNQVTGLEMKDRRCPNELGEDMAIKNGSQKSCWVFTVSGNV